MSGLHAGEIECLLSRVFSNDTKSHGTSTRAILTPKPHVRWLGVFARDELPDLKKEKRPFALVLNTDPRSKPGQHWLALYGPSENSIELFDSFGQHPSNYGLAYISPTYSFNQFQSLTSTFCGHYCIYFLYLRTHNQTFNEIINYLKKIIDTDIWVKDYVTSLQRTYKTLNPCNRTGQCSKLKCSFC